MLKRFTCILAGLAMLIWTCPPAQAGFKGTLQRDQAWTMNVDNSVSTTAALTIFYLGRNLEVMEMITVPSGARVAYEFPRIGRGVKRVFIEVDPSVGGQIGIEVLQGTMTFTESNFSNNQPFRMVFNVE